MNATIAACSCCCIVPVAVRVGSTVSGGLPTTIGANEDTTDDGTPAEVMTLTMDEVSPSSLGEVVNEKARVVMTVVGGKIVVAMTAGEETEFGRLETSVIADATMDSWEFDSVDNLDICAGLEEDRSVEVSDRLVLSLEIVCVTDVMAELGNESSLTTLEDVGRWMEAVSLVNATTDSVRVEVNLESKLLDSAGL